MTRDPVEVAAEILNWTGEPGCYGCDVHGPRCLSHGVIPDERLAQAKREARRWPA